MMPTIKTGVEQIREIRGVAFPGWTVIGSDATQLKVGLSIPPGQFTHVMDLVMYVMNN